MPSYDSRLKYWSLAGLTTISLSSSESLTILASNEVVSTPDRMRRLRVSAGDSERHVVVCATRDRDQTFKYREPVTLSAPTINKTTHVFATISHFSTQHHSIPKKACLPL